MRGISIALCFALCASLAVAAEGPGDPLTSNVAKAGYTLTEEEYSNPGTNIDATPLLSSSPDCTVRPETVIEIQKMRATSASLADAMVTEMSNMSRRKGYIEQMTNYINDRIRDLNKVKAELRQESRWMDNTNAKINEMAENEHLVKYQDILACLGTEQEAAAGASAAKKDVIKKISEKANAMQANIKSIRQNMADIKAGKEGGATEAPAA